MRSCRYCAILDEAFGLDHAMLTTLHSVMNDQPLIDGYHHTDLHRTRSAMQSMIPVSTGLARGVQRMLPELAGRIESKAIRVPVVNVSAIDLVATLRRGTTAAEVKALLRGRGGRRRGGAHDVYRSPPCLHRLQP
jgi:D-erythrose 4-phosphate dehydrogenase